MSPPLGTERGFGRHDLISILGYDLELGDDSYHVAVMVKHAGTQEDRAVRLLGAHGMIRHAELTKAGITGATVSRMKAKGLIVQLGRGLYQLADAPLDGNHTLAEAAKAVP